MIARGDLVCVVMAYQGGGRYGDLDASEWDVAVTVGRCAPFSAIGGVR